MAEIFKLHDAFAAAMEQLGPFEPDPALAVAVSGGADSMALALLAYHWAAERRGTVQALVVDHGLRHESADEADLTVARLAACGITSSVLRLTSLRRGSRLAERARVMRYQTLTAACASAGLLHLLLGHHAMDQAETLMMRVLSQSMTHGLAGMPGVTETCLVRLLRPLLAFQPANLRRFLHEQDIAWVEDPSNRDLRALRPRLRHLSGARLNGRAPAAPHGYRGSPLHALMSAAVSAGIARGHEEVAVAKELAARVMIWPEGFALLSPGRIGVDALASLIQTIGGAPYGPSLRRIAVLAADPRPATVAGVRLLPGGRMGHGLVLIREEAAIGGSIAAELGAVWDGRFRLHVGRGWPEGTTIGKLGDDAARFRGRSTLPSAVLRTLPALRCGKTLAAVPHLQYALDKTWAESAVLLEPRKPLAGVCFLPIIAWGGKSAPVGPSRRDFHDRAQHPEGMGMQGSASHTM